MSNQESNQESYEATLAAARGTLLRLIEPDRVPPLMKIPTPILEKFAFDLRAIEATIQIELGLRTAGEQVDMA